MITCQPDYHGHLVATVDQNTLQSYGMARGRNAKVYFWCNGDLDDYPDWFESYPRAVDALIRDCEIAVRLKFERIIQCCASSSVH